MLIAATTGTDGKKRLVVGLQEQNMQRRRNDQPIARKLDDVPGLEDWTLYVLGPEDLARFVARARAEGVQGPDGPL